MWSGEVLRGDYIRTKEGLLCVQYVFVVVEGRGQHDRQVMVSLTLQH